MKVWSALLMMLFLGVAAEAQRGRMAPGRMAPGFQGRGPIRSIPPVVNPLPPTVRAGPRFVSPVVRPQGGFHQGFRPGYRPYFYPGFNSWLNTYPVSPIVSPYSDYYPYGGSPISPEPYYPSESAPFPNPTSSGEENVDYLNNQIQRLTDEVQRLEDALYATSTTVPTPTPETAPVVEPAAPQRPAIPTIMIFTDGRRLESQGYAIAGEMLWVFTENGGSQTFPLSELNVAATRSENSKRGIQFRVP
jgi:hypothetical protein